MTSFWRITVMWKIEWWKHHAEYSSRISNWNKHSWITNHPCKLIFIWKHLFIMRLRIATVLVWVRPRSGRNSFWNIAVPVRSWIEHHMKWFLIETTWNMERRVRGHCVEFGFSSSSYLSLDNSNFLFFNGNIKTPNWIVQTKVD